MHIDFSDRRAGSLRPLRNRFVSNRRAQWSKFVRVNCRVAAASLLAGPAVCAEAQRTPSSDLTGTTFGTALIYVNGPIDFATGLPNQPVEVTLDNLGIYDQNGQWVSSNNGRLTGKYLQTDVDSINDPANGISPIGPLTRSNNDFRVNPFGDATIDPRSAILGSAEAHAYFFINDYRKRFLNDAFIDELQLPTQLAQNLKNLQYRPDGLYAGGQQAARQKPTFRVQEEYYSLSGQVFLPIDSVSIAEARTRGAQYASLPPISLTWDPSLQIGEYAGLAAFWILGSNKGFTNPAFYGDNASASFANVTPAMSDGLTAWAAYRYTGDPVPFRYTLYGARATASSSTSNVSAGPRPYQSASIRNVMMYDEANTTADGVFPFSRPTGSNYNNGLIGSDLAGQFFAAIFYDLANDSGLGLHKADLLHWKTISLVTQDVSGGSSTPYTMRNFALTLQQAARALFPDPRVGHAGQSLYEKQILDVLTSRGIPVNGVANFRNNLPAAIGSYPSTLQISSANGF